MTKKDNSELWKKLKLREAATDAATGGEPPRVLDLFAGYGRMWKSVPTASYIGFEKNKKKKSAGVMNVDNPKVINGLDLAEFDVIDCDAYGVPDKQLIELLRNGTMRDGAAVVYTCITDNRTPMPLQLADRVGMRAMCNKSPALARKVLDSAFYDLLREFSRTRHEYRIELPNETKRYGFVVFGR